MGLVCCVINCDPDPPIVANNTAPLYFEHNTILILLTLPLSPTILLHCTLNTILHYWAPIVANNTASVLLSPSYFEHNTTLLPLSLRRYHLYCTFYSILFYCTTDVTKNNDLPSLLLQKHPTLVHCYWSSHCRSQYCPQQSSHCHCATTISIVRFTQYYFIVLLIVTNNTALSSLLLIKHPILVHWYWSSHCRS
jgi:hypothetical protein